jgi:acyl-CoA synthetase (AMP-forming)/AMP-acid ligase II
MAVGTVEARSTPPRACSGILRRPRTSARGNEGRPPCREKGPFRAARARTPRPLRRTSWTATSTGLNEASADVLRTQAGHPVRVLGGATIHPGDRDPVGLLVHAFDVLRLRVLMVHILGDDGRPVPAEKEGAVAIRLPLPPGTLPTLWQDDERFKDVYLSKFPGYYATGDGGYYDEDGYLFIMGRIDDVIIVAGHNLSTGSMEQAIASHADVAECAVFGVRDPLRTQLPLGLVVLKVAVRRDHDQIVGELVEIVREQVGPVANYKMAGVVSRLPKTRSGKILRGIMRQIADGEPYKVPSTIDDPAILDEITLALRQLGYARETKGKIGG